ncbi:MAG: hypothetical protein J1E97_04420 [Muribaculaceae bacterium]|nr:hypothetical protein [Muribaculaceae bacterium]
MEDNRKNEIEKLKIKLEEALGVKVRTPKHFEQLRNLVFIRTGEYLSTTTLKRIWGYLNEPLKTRITTLIILAQTLGYRDWDDFEDSIKNGNEQTIDPSHLSMTRCIKLPTDLMPGQKVTLFWFPNRVCTIRYTGDLSFEVENSENTQLQAGDTFSCHLILEGYPLYISKLVKGDAAPVTYICGKQNGGMRFIIHSSDQEQDQAKIE